jgi:hypothetical protein
MQKLESLRSNNRGFPIKSAALDAFDFLIVAFLNIGRFYGKNDGLNGEREPELFTLTPDFVKAHHSATSSWEKVLLAGLDDELEPFAGARGFELIAKSLGIPRPRRSPSGNISEPPANRSRRRD